MAPGGRNDSLSGFCSGSGNVDHRRGSFDATATTIQCHLQGARGSGRQNTWCLHKPVDVGKAGLPSHRFRTHPHANRIAGFSR